MRAAPSQAQRQSPELSLLPFRKSLGYRASAFSEWDQPALRALPEPPYKYTEWTKERGDVDYHVDIGVHYYAVPCQHARPSQRPREAPRSVSSSAATAHRQPRALRLQGRHTTIAAHMSPAHREVAGWNAATLTARAEAAGPRCVVLVRRLQDQRRHP